MITEPNRTEEVFTAALQRRSGPERAAFLESACGEDSALREHIEALLSANDSAGDFLKSPAEGGLGVAVGSRDFEEPGTMIGPYKLLEMIGEGGFGVVYMAEQEEPIRRRVALKIIRLGMDTRQVVARFEAERQSLAMMDHPNIAKVFDAGATESGRPYFAMELVTGISIIDYCDSNKLSTRDRLDLFIQVCNAIQHAHQKGIIHRDIKPSNVMVAMHDGRPVPKVIDFGIAKAIDQKLTEKTLFTRYAHVIGTPAYMSPEQAEMNSCDIDTCSDIYSLGVLLYELLTGVTPLSAEELRKAGYAEMQRIIREEEPALPSTRLSTMGEMLATVAQQRKTHPDVLKRLVRGDLDWIVMKSLEKDRTRRYATASELTADIERHLRSEPVSAGPPSTLYRMKKLVQRHSVSVVAAAVAAIGLVIGLAVSMAMYLRADRARQREASALAEARIVTDFLTNDLLASVYPERAKGREVTVSHILDSASERLDERTVDSPFAEAAIRDALALTYQKMARYAEARPHMQRALEIRRAELGEEHPDTLTSLNRLGRLYFYQGHHAEAQQLMCQAYEIRKRILGPEHRDTLESMSHLAWYDEQSKTRAPEFAQKTYETAKRLLGEDDPITLQAATALAMKYMLGSHLEQAQALIPNAYEHSRRVLGEEHETTLILMNTLVWLRAKQERYDVGTALGEKALKIAQQALGEAHPTTIHAMCNVGMLYTTLRRGDEAAPVLLRAIELGEQHLGEDYCITLLARLQLGILYYRQRRYEEHEALFIDLIRRTSQRAVDDSVFFELSKYWLERRSKELAQDATKQSASGDHEGAAVTLNRLEKVQRALEGGPEKETDIENE